MGQPRAPLTRRFGSELCRRLDQALGDIAEPIIPLRPEGLIEVLMPNLVSDNCAFCAMSPLYFKTSQTMPKY